MSDYVKVKFENKEGDQFVCFLKDVNPLVAMSDVVLRNGLITKCRYTNEEIFTKLLIGDGD